MEDKYNRDFPERYNWSLIDSYKLSELAEAISWRINADLKTEKKIYTPGLRLVLQCIAVTSGLDKNEIR